MTHTIKPFLFGALVMFSLQANAAESITDEQLISRGCKLVMVTKAYAKGVWHCPSVENYDALPPVVQEDSGCVLTHKNLGQIFRAAFGVGVSTKDIAAASLDQYRECSDVAQLGGG